LYYFRIFVDLTHLLTFSYASQFEANNSSSIHTHTRTHTHTHSYLENACAIVLDSIQVRAYTLSVPSVSLCICVSVRPSVRVAAAKVAGKKTKAFCGRAISLLGIWVCLAQFILSVISFPRSTKLGKHKSDFYSDFYFECDFDCEYNSQPMSMSVNVFDTMQIIDNELLLKIN